MAQNFHKLFAPILYVIIFLTGFLTAAIWLSPDAYLEHLTDVLTAFSLAAFVTLAFLFCLFSLKRNTLKQLEILQREHMRPILRAALQLSPEHPNLLVCHLHNYGKGFAKHIRIRAEALTSTPAADLITEKLNSLPVFSDGLDMMAANEPRSFILFDLDDMPDTAAPDSDGLIKIHTVCNDIFGSLHSNETTLDLSGLVRPHTPKAKAKPKLLY